MVAVGVLALQGALEGLDALITPGGESTTIARLLALYKLIEPIRAFAARRPVWGTCAGMIVMAKRATDLDQETLRLIDIDVVRNAYGRQVDSFETDVSIDEIEGPPVHAVFIRAPLVRAVGPGVKVLGRLADETIVAARQGHLLVTAFHPELTEDTRLHSYFISL